MTAFALEGDKEKCLQAGMDDYISKPFMIEEIVQRIEKWSGKSGDQSDIMDMDVFNRLRVLNPEDPEKFIRELTSMFFRQAPLLINEIEQYCLSKDYSSLWKAAHKLKGSALNLGAKALGEACRIMEVAGRENNIDDCNNMVSRMKAIYSRTEDELQQILNT
jgi:HPt (histidine-containing phosphotransfer) domain-containing protein